jgi:hypothetical protein
MARVRSKVSDQLVRQVLGDSEVGRASTFESLLTSSDLKVLP